MIQVVATIHIDGVLNGFSLIKLILEHISQWGGVRLVNQGYQFFGCHNLHIYTIDDLDTTTITNMSSMFEGAYSFNGNISGWNTVACTNMRSMFSGASSFNGDLSGWDYNNRNHEPNKIIHYPHYPYIPP